MILIIDNQSKHIEELKQILADLGVETKVENRKAPMEEIEQGKYKGIIFSGGNISMTDPINFEDISDDIACLLDFDIPVLGICMGHQVIGEAFGGKMKKLPEKVHGQNKIIITKNTGVLEGLGGEEEVYESHQNEVVKQPYGFELLAYSNNCDIEAMQHKTKPIYSVQFHPEASGEVGKKVIENFLKICGEIE